MYQVRFGFAKRHRLFVEGNELVASESVAPDSLLEVMRSYGRDLTLRLIPESQFSNRLQQVFAERASGAASAVDAIGESLDLDAAAAQVDKQDDLLDNEDDAPVIRMLNAVIADALRKQASDIHLDLYELNARVRFRLDGALQNVLEVRPEVLARLVARIKVLAKLNIAEKRLPQDGRITVHLGGRAIDLRVSTLPSIHGERVVMRVLENQGNRVSITDLGLNETGIDTLRQLINRPNGIILVTGPTGSGKTTTLYAALQMLDANERNIMTVEDPVEYKLPGISQTPISTKTGMTFAAGLRAILRQDPDVILVGEIRDGETAEIATQASLTGHLVLSTLHTNTAAGAITRLRDLGVDNFLLSATVRGVIAQRLIRRLCSQCKTESLPDMAISSVFADHQLQTPEKIYHSKGCDQCNHTGYRGRQAVYEMVTLTPDLQQLIHDDAGELAIEREIRKHQPSMVSQGLGLVAQGITTFEEVMRVTMI
ncbi:GspE/PulE family protein [Marinobacterium sp. YM272]|uniref:GspE/PulE family protein n=1 Tax=Marinobacterium sp. YM272 TaxID=3421654 RepID=UPI003D7FB034